MHTVIFPFVTRTGSMKLRNSVRFKIKHTLRHGEVLNVFTAYGALSVPDTGKEEPNILSVLLFIPNQKLLPRVNGSTAPVENLSSILGCHQISLLTIRSTVNVPGVTRKRDTTGRENTQRDSVSSRTRTDQHSTPEQVHRSSPVLLTSSSLHPSPSQHLCIPHNPSSCKSKKH